MGAASYAASSDIQRSLTSRAVLTSYRLMFMQVEMMRVTSTHIGGQDLGHSIEAASVSASGEIMKQTVQAKLEALNASTATVR